MADKGPDEMYCESCGDVIKQEAEICPHCGVRNASGGGGASTGASGQAAAADPHSEGLFSFAVKYPISMGWMPIIIGAVMTLFSFLILPIIVLYGYGYRLGRAAARGDDVGPEFDDWGGLIKDGALLFVAFLPFGIILFGIFGFMFLIAALLDSLAVTLIIGLIAFVIYLVAIYVGGAILPAFIATGSLKGTYAGGRFLKIATTKDYAIGFVFLFVITFVISLVLNIVIGFISLITLGIGSILGVPVSLVLGPYLFYLAASLFGFVIWDSDSAKIPDVASDAKLEADV